MRVVLLHSFYSSHMPSGENSVVRDQIRALKELGLDVHLISKDTDSQVHRLGYHLRSALRVGTGFGSSPEAMLQEIRPDVVHIHNLFPNFGTRWLTSTQFPLVMSLHNFRFVCSNAVLFRSGEQCWECVDRGPLRAVRHACYRDSRLATVPLAVSRNSYSETLSHDISTLVTTSPGSDAVVRRILPDARVRLVPNFGQGEAETGVRPRRDRWLALGRFSQEKGFAELARDWPRSRDLLLVGDGPQLDTIRAWAESKSISILGSVDRHAMRELLRASTGLVFPSRWVEVAPQVVIEAMRLGLPVVAHRSNGVADVVMESRAGATYDSKPTLELALSQVDDNWLQMSRNASEYFLANWTKHEWQERILDVYTNAGKGAR